MCQRQRRFTEGGSKIIPNSSVMRDYETLNKDVEEVKFDSKTGSFDLLTFWVMVSFVLFHCALVCVSSLFLVSIFLFSKSGIYRRVPSSDCTVESLVPLSRFLLLVPII